MGFGVSYEAPLRHPGGLLRLILTTLRYGNYGIFLIMGNAGFISSTVSVIYKGSKWSLGFRYLQVHG